MWEYLRLVWEDIQGALGIFQGVPEELQETITAFDFAGWWENLNNSLSEFAALFSSIPGVTSEIFSKWWTDVSPSMQEVLNVLLYLITFGPFRDVFFN